MLILFYIKLVKNWLNYMMTNRTIGYISRVFVPNFKLNKNQLEPGRFCSPSCIPEDADGFDPNLSIEDAGCV